MPLATRPQGCGALGPIGGDPTLVMPHPFELSGHGDRLRGGEGGITSAFWKLEATHEPRASWGHVVWGVNVVEQSRRGQGRVFSHDAWASSHEIPV